MFSLTRKIASKLYAEHGISTLQSVGLTIVCVATVSAGMTVAQSAAPAVKSTFTAGLENQTSCYVGSCRQPGAFQSNAGTSTQANLPPGYYSDQYGNVWDAQGNLISGSQYGANSQGGQILTGAQTTAFQDQHLPPGYSSDANGNIWDSNGNLVSGPNAPPENGQVLGASDQRLPLGEDSSKVAGSSATLRDSPQLPATHTSMLEKIIVRSPQLAWDMLDPLGLPDDIHSITEVMQTINQRKQVSDDQLIDTGSIIVGFALDKIPITKPYFNALQWATVPIRIVHDTVSGSGKYDLRAWGHAVTHPIETLTKAKDLVTGLAQAWWSLLANPQSLPDSP